LGNGLAVLPQWEGLSGGWGNTRIGEQGNEERGTSSQWRKPPGDEGGRRKGDGGKGESKRKKIAKTRKSEDAKTNAKCGRQARELTNDD
jgi:hypothetical protein